MFSIKSSGPEGLLDSRQLGRIHSASLEILRECGMAFGSPEALAVFKAHGLKVSGETVFFSDAIVEKSLAMVPDEFTLIGRDPSRNIDFSFETQVSAPGSGAVYVVGPEGRPAPALREDFLKAAKLNQALPQMKLCRPLFIPHDLAPNKQWAWMMVQQILHQDKPYYLMSGEQVPLLALAFGLSEDRMREEALVGRVHGLAPVSIVSPLYMPAEACRDLLSFCRAGVAFSVSSMPSAASTAPCSLAATVLMQNCENIGACVLAQLLSPGQPMFYGAMGGLSDMKRLSNIYGGPESRLIALAGSQLARYYGLLSRADVGATEAMEADFQAGAESMLQIFASALQRINLLPGCGYLGGYMGGSLEKMLLDAELYDYALQLRNGLQFGEDDLAVDVIKEIGPKGNFINHPHTFKRFRQFCQPAAFGRTSYEGWRKAGYPRNLDLAKGAVERLLAAYRRPDIDPGLEKDLLKYC